MKEGVRAVLAVITLLIAPALSTTPARQPSVADGKLRFEVPDLEGTLVSSVDPRFEGKVLLVTLWATWCPPCLSEIPTLIDLQSRFGERGLVVVAIAFEDDELPTRRERLSEFRREREINYLVLDGGLPEEFENTLPGVQDVTGLPVEILVDREGEVFKARNSYGFKKSWVKRLEREINALLDPTADP